MRFNFYNTLLRFKSICTVALRKTMPVLRFTAKAIGSIVRCLGRFPNTLTCIAVGAAATLLLHNLPGWLRYLDYIGILGTVALAMRSAWVDLGATATENRITRRTSDVISQTQDRRE